MKIIRIRTPFKVNMNNIQKRRNTIDPEKKFVFKFTKKNLPLKHQRHVTFGEDQKRNPSLKGRYKENKANTTGCVES